MRGSGFRGRSSSICRCLERRIVAREVCQRANATIGIDGSCSPSTPPTATPFEKLYGRKPRPEDAQGNFASKLPKTWK